MIAGELRAKLLRQLRGQAGLQGNAPATHQYTRRRRCGGRRRDRRAWLRCPWAAAGPGRTTRRRTEPHASTPGPTGVEGAEGMEGQAAVPAGGGAWPDNEATHRTTRQHTRPHWRGGRRRDGGPGCGARGRRQGLAGLRGDAPSEARGADSSRAAGPTGTHSGRAHRRPEHQRSHKQQHTARTARGRPGPPAPGTPAAQHAT